MYRKTVSSVMLVLLVTSMLVLAVKIQPASADVDWWPMFHHDLYHTGYSTSTGPTTNNTLWTYTIGSLLEGSAAVVGGLVYVGSWDDSVCCLDAANGTFVWSYTTGAGVGSSPAVVGGLVYVGSDDGHVYCLNAASGTQVWNYTTGGVVYSSPAVVGGLVYVGSFDHNVYCLDAASGTQVWNYTTGGKVESSPAVVGGLVYVGSDDGHVYCLNAASGTQVWNYTTGGYVASSPAVVGGLVYVGSGWDGHVYCLDAATGTFVWSYPATTSAGAWSSPAVVGGVVYVGYGDGHVYCLDAASGTQVWNYTTGGKVESSPAVVGGLVYVGSFDHNVYCLNAASGTQVWNYTTGGVVYFSPAVVNGVVYVGSDDGNIYAFGPSPPLTVSISPSSSTLDVGQSQLFNSSVSGGASPYTYQWYVNYAPVSDATSNHWTFSPTSGSYTVYLNVTDSVGVIAISNTATVNVNGSPSVSILPSSVVMDVGQSQTFNSTISGGTLPYSYQWCLNGTAVPNANSGSWNFTPTSAGSYAIYANVTDSVGVQATSNTATVTVKLHDVAVTNVTFSKTGCLPMPTVGRGYGLNITVTAANLGNYSETFNVTVYANTTYLASQNITLSSGTATNITLTWNTTGFAYGNYTISAYAWPVPGETNTANNNFTGGVVAVTIPGDINGDFKVNLSDLGLLAKAYNAHEANYHFKGEAASPNWNTNADINGDGTVNLSDLGILAKHYNQHYP